MWRSIQLRAGLIAAFLLLSVVFLIPTLVDPLPKWWTKFLPAEKINLGLDLQGGTHMILQVKVEEAVSLENDQDRNHLANRMREQQINYGSIEKLNDTQFVVRNVGEGQSGQFRDLVTQTFGPRWEVAVAPGEASGFTLTMRGSEVSRIRAETLRQAVETIDRRVNALGLEEATVTEHGRGENEILVQLPGVGDPKRVKDIIRAGGMLEFRLVRGDREYSSEADCLAAHGGILPPGTECVPGQPSAAAAGSTLGAFPTSFQWSAPWRTRESKNDKTKLQRFHRRHIHPNCAELQNK